MIKRILALTFDANGNVKLPCSICDITCHSLKAWNRHILTSTHLNKIISKEIEVVPAELQVSIPDDCFSENGDKYIYLSDDDESITSDDAAEDATEDTDNAAEATGYVADANETVSSNDDVAADRVEINDIATGVHDELCQRLSEGTSHVSPVCTVCEKIFTSQSQAEAHYAGAIHAKKVREAKESSQRKCTLCNVVFNSQLEEQQHLATDEHKNIVEIFAQIVSKDSRLELTLEKAGNVAVNNRDLTNNSTRIDEDRSDENYVNAGENGEKMDEYDSSNKRPTDDHRRGPSETYECNICNITMWTEKHYDQHCSGKRHLKMVKEISAASTKAAAAATGSNISRSSESASKSYDNSTKSSGRVRSSTASVDKNSVRENFTTVERHRRDVVVPSKRHSCRVCDKVFPCEGPAKHHFASKAHAKRVKDSTKDRPQKCMLCDASFKSLAQAQAHIDGKEHKANVERLKAKLNKASVLELTRDEVGTVNFNSKSSRSTSEVKKKIVNDDVEVSKQAIRELAVDLEAPSWLAKRTEYNYSCTVCNIPYLTKLQYEFHYKGKRHAKALSKLAETASALSLNIDDFHQYRCHVCRKVFRNELFLKAHNTTEKHKVAARALESLKRNHFHEFLADTELNDEIGKNAHLKIQFGRCKLCDKLFQLMTDANQHYSTYPHVIRLKRALKAAGKLPAEDESSLDMERFKKFEFERFFDKGEMEIIGSLECEPCSIVFDDCSAAIAHMGTEEHLKAVAESTVPVTTNGERFRNSDGDDDTNGEGNRNMPKYFTTAAAAAAANVPRYFTSKSTTTTAAAAAAAEAENAAEVTASPVSPARESSKSALATSPITSPEISPTFVNSVVKIENVENVSSDEDFCGDDDEEELKELMKVEIVSSEDEEDFGCCGNETISPEVRVVENTENVSSGDEDFGNDNEVEVLKLVEDTESISEEEDFENFEANAKVEDAESVSEEENFSDINGDDNGGSDDDDDDDQLSLSNFIELDGEDWAVKDEYSAAESESGCVEGGGATEAEPSSTEVESTATEVQPTSPSEVALKATVVEPNTIKVEPVAIEVGPSSVQVEGSATKVQPSSPEVAANATEVEPTAIETESTPIKVIKFSATDVEPNAVMVEQSAAANAAMNAPDAADVATSATEVMANASEVATSVSDDDEVTAMDVESDVTKLVSSVPEVAVSVPEVAALSENSAEAKPTTATKTTTVSLKRTKSKAETDHSDVTIVKRLRSSARHK